MLAALTYVLVVAACSKKKEEVAAKSQAVAPSTHPAVIATPAVLPKPAEKKVLPIVSPGHLPPNPRVPQGGPSMTDAATRQRLLAQPLPAEQPSPATAATGAEPAPPTPVTSAYTPEQGNQARLNALQEMFRQRGQKEVPPQPGGVPASTGEEKSAPLKTQP